MRGSRTARVLAAAVVGALGLLAQPHSAPASAATKPYVVLSITQSGGFIPWAWAQMRTPQVVLYSDGTLLATAAATTMQYPGAAAPTILRKVSAASIPRVLAAADAAKVTTPKFDWGFPGVADAPNTDFTSQRSPSGPTAFVSVYALGISGPGLTKVQTSARVAAADLVSKLQAFDGVLVPTKSMPTPWISPRWSYFAQPAVADQFSVVRPWFGSKPLMESMTCVDFTASENRSLIALLPKLNHSSRWRSGGQTWQLQLRPLFPHEAGCAGSR